MAARADALALRSPADRGPALTVGLTALVTTLAMNHVQRGAYLL
jgi:hypothetical protein